MQVSRSLLSIAVSLCALEIMLPLRGEEPARAFLDGLRSRGYNDIALDYLQGLETSPLAPSGFRQIIPYERALTLIESARKQRDLEVRVQDLNHAQELLKRFVDSQASHPKAFAARSQLGSLIVERARIKVEQSKSGNTKALMQEVRQLYEQAFKEFSGLEAAVSQELEKIPKVLDTRDRKEAALAVRRTQLRADSLQTELLAAAIREETADTVPKGSKDHTAYLTEAASLYDGIYKKYRSRLAGLYARMYQGRCNQRLGKTKDALGYYGELLDQPSAPEFRELKTMTLRLAMECWLAPGEKKYFEAIKQASQWLSSAPRNTDREPDMLAVRLSLARAYKMQADDYEIRGSKDARTINLSIDAALTNAEFVANEPGELQEDAQKLVVNLGGRNRGAERSEPKTFTQAQQAGKKALDAIGPSGAEVAKLQQQLKRASESERAQLAADVSEAQTKLATTQTKAMDAYRLALQFADQDTPPSELNLVRYFVCYLYYLQQQYHEAALVGDLVSRRYPESAGARECVKISLACYRKMLEASPDDDTSFEIERLVSLANYTTDTWPDSPESLMALTTLVPVLVNAGQLQYARELTLRIPETTPTRGEAELITGQAMWGKHLGLLQQLQKWERDGVPEGVDVAERQAESEDLASNATQLLAAGYARLPEQPAINTSNATALLSLAQAYVAAGEHVSATEVLEQATIGPITLVNANHQSVKNPLFIEETYRTALQAYVGSLGSGGAAMMEKAKVAMAAMQQAVGSDAAGKQRMLGIYVNLAQNVEKQMTSASLQAKQEMSKVFEAFLQELSAGSSDIGVLNWVAETFASVGAGFDDNPEILNEEARKYYARSIAAFQNILSMGDLQPQLATQMKVRMASVKSQMHDFQEALTHLEEVLGETPNAINVQIEAAQLLQRWAKSEPAKYQQAISGVEDGVVWGWGQIANKTLQYKQFRDTFYQARYQMAECQFQLAQTKQGDARKKLVAAARRGLTKTKQLYPTLGGEKWTQLYDELLKNIER